MTVHVCCTIIELWPFGVFSRKALPGTEVGRQSVSRSVFNITLISYTPLLYVRNVAREELKCRSFTFFCLKL